MFYDNLKKACMNKGTTVTSTLKALGLGTANGTFWKNGSSPSGEVLIQLSEFLDVSVDYLLKGESFKENYSDCYVAFIDILGFKNFINDKDTTFDKVKDLYDLLKIISNEFSSVTQSDFFTPDDMSKVVLNVISDTIVLSIEKSQHYSLEILIFAVNIVVSNVLLNHQLLFRGAISEGNFYSKAGILFGNALVDAAILEKDRAKYPRIVIQKNVLENYLNTHKTDIETDKGINYLTELDCIAKDSLYIINYIKYIIYRLITIKKTVSEVTSLFEPIISIVEKNIKDTNNEDVKQKNIYFAKYFNYELKQISVDNSEFNSLRINLFGFDIKKSPIESHSDYLLTGKEKSPKSELSDLERELLEKFNRLEEVDKGRILGRMDIILDEYNRPIENANTARVAAFGGKTQKVPDLDISLNDRIDAIERQALIDEIKASQDPKGN